MSNKRYYWLKLQDNFFEKEEIKIIENMPNGKDYIIFYMKLLLKSVSTEGKLMFREIIPYTPEMLASITNTNIDTVRVAIDMFSKLSLMEIWDDGTLFMVETQNMIGSETKWAKKKRLQREKQKELPSKEDNVQAEGDNVPPLSQNCPTEIDTEIELDKELDIDKDIELDSNYVEFFNNNFHLITKYELDTLKSYEDDKLQPRLITLALQKAVDKNKRSLDYVKGILNNWLKNNIKTVEDAEAREKEFKREKEEKKTKYSNVERKDNGAKVDSFNGYQQRTYDGSDGSMTFDDLEKKLLGWK
ncbi:phage replisome organizer N-terminal domain-containing protein [Clostridium tetani]|uniref:replisome organizer n=1 Tax=Clostridium phage phiCT19406C TaxID=1567011 RepID=UPI000572A9B1|nr:phage replisome organizer N-terminal domain-containing protein [Clostridium tetani]YP_009218042.1 replisome organizer [Clostridium phage phiCT19406C]AJA42836.1 replisome organizer [Clostridium phage phiCT19406C]RXI62316.1 DnaD domain protein [Clostridium tetani]RXI69559.1 DnaD domain protein [Clostridium tetani]SJZ95596.1 phage replisome organizer, putative, N-terminal region [Clostridium tetani]